MIDVEPQCETDTIPQFFCPIDPAINPYKDKLHDRSLRWACDAGVVRTDTEAYDYLKATRLSDLTAYTMPFVSPADIELAAAWYIWLFIYDDHVDADKQKCPVDKLQSINAQLFPVLDGHRTKPTEPLARGLLDICQRINIRSNAWRRRFTDSVKTIIQSMMWERSMRMEGIFPDLATYLKMRLFTGAVDSCYIMAALTGNIAPDASFWQHVYIRTLNNIANYYVCWVNDVLWVKKEIREDSSSNLVLVLQNEYGISLQEAVNHGVDIANKEMEAFLRLKGMLPSFGPIEDEYVQRYIAALQYWMRGHLDWAKTSRRYQEEMRF
jgi:terpene synthase-like protein